MKKLAIVLCAAAMAATAVAPAIAQPGPGAEQGEWGLAARINAVQGAIDRAVNDGALDRPEYGRVQRELDRIRQRANAFRQTHGGQLSPMVRREAESDLDAVVNQIHWMRAGAWRRPW